MTKLKPKIKLFDAHLSIHVCKPSATCKKIDEKDHIKT
jgi:hypothetical protein